MLDSEPCAAHVQRRATVSVVVVNHNAGELLRRCVDSLMNGSDDVEVFVVDNASEDGSLDGLDGFARVCVIRNAENLGFAAACNLGLRKASGRFLLFLNPDCTISRDSLTILLDAIENDDRIGMVGGLLLNPDGSEQGGGRRAVPTPWRSFVRAFGLHRFSKFWPKLFFDFHLHKSPLPPGPVEVEAISGSCMLVKREALEDSGEWDEGYFLHCEDLDWCMRFREKGWKILFIPSAEVEHAQGACSRGRPFFVEWHKHRGMIRFYRKFFKQSGPLGLSALISVGVWMRFGLVCLLRSLRLCAKRFRFPL